MELFEGNAVFHFLGLLLTFSLCALGLMLVVDRDPKHLVKEGVYTIISVMLAAGFFLVFNMVWDDFVRSGSNRYLVAAYTVLGLMGFMLIRAVAHAIKTNEILGWRRHKKMMQNEVRQRTIVVLGDQETWDYVDNCCQFTVPVDENGIPYGGNAQVENMVRHTRNSGGAKVEIDSFRAFQGAR